MKLARTAHIVCQRAPSALTGAAASCLVAVHRARAATPAPDSVSVCTAWEDTEPAAPESYCESICEEDVTLALKELDERCEEEEADFSGLSRSD